MVYQYIAYDRNGEVVKGRLSATSEKTATELLGYAGYEVVNLKPSTPFLSLDKLSPRLFPVKTAEIVLFYRQLALLLESGIDIITSMELLQSQSPSRTLKLVLGEVISDLRSGKQLSASLEKHPEIFSSLYCCSLRVGEQTGDLETMLKQMADYVEKEATTTKSTKNALKFPIMAGILTIGVLGLLITFVFPSIGRLYTSIGADLPTLTKVLIDVAGKFQSYGIYLLLAVFVIVGLAYTYARTPGGRYRRDKLSLRLPLVGRVNHLNELARCCRSMSMLFRAGLPLTEIMSMVVQGSGNMVMSKALTDVQQDMLKGEGLSRPMSKNALFLPMMVQMVKVGEETGRLDTTVLAVARSYEAEAADRTRSLIGLIQPTMTLVIGLAVGFIALSLTSAMYSIYGQGF